MLKFQTALKQGEDTRKVLKVKIFFKKITFFCGFTKKPVAFTLKNRARSSKHRHRIIFYFIMVYITHIFTIFRHFPSNLIFDFLGATLPRILLITIIFGGKKWQQKVWLKSQ